MSVSSLSLAYSPGIASGVESSDCEGEAVSDLSCGLLTGSVGEHCEGEPVSDPSCGLLTGNVWDGKPSKKLDASTSGDNAVLLGALLAAAQRGAATDSSETSVEFTATVGGERGLDLRDPAIVGALRVLRLDLTASALFLLRFLTGALVEWPSVRARSGGGTTLAKVWGDGGGVCPLQRVWGGKLLAR